MDLRINIHSRSIEEKEQKDKEQYNNKYPPSYWNHTGTASLLKNSCGISGIRFSWEISLRLAFETLLHLQLALFSIISTSAPPTFTVPFTAMFHPHVSSCHWPKHI